MGKLIAVVGAGGKSRWIETRARAAAKSGVRVAVTTSTHIWKPKRLSEGGVDWYGCETEDGQKLSAPEPEEFMALRQRYELVLVEADGSRHYPIKLPGEREPVLPALTDEVVLVLGRSALGRPVGEVCQRFFLAKALGLTERFPGLNEYTTVTEAMLNCIADIYEQKIRAQLPYVAVRRVFSDMSPALAALSGPMRIRLVLLASGSGQRFGGNKLMADFCGRPLVSWGMSALKEAALSLSEALAAQAPKLQAECSCQLVSCHEAVLALAAQQGWQCLYNPAASEGIAASVRLAAAAAQEDGCELLVYFVGDQPYLDAVHIRLFIMEMLASGRASGCAFSAGEPVNPAAFRSCYFPELQQLSGDKGAMRLIRRDASAAHYFVIAPAYLRDIDYREDLR